jgi:hypothetical protein
MPFYRITVVATVLLAMVSDVGFAQERFSVALDR